MKRSTSVTIKKKINLFGNFSYSDETTYNDDDYERKFYGDNKLLNASVLLQNRQKNIAKNFFTRIGLDYLASTATTYGVIINLNTGPRNGFLNYYSNSYNALGEPDSIGTGSSVTNDSRKNLGINLNYLHKFDNTGREISADVNYLHYKSTGSQALQNFNYANDGILNNSNSFYYQLPSNINIYTFKADYTHPFKNNAGLEAGVKSGIVNNDNDAQYLTSVGTVTMPDYSKSNHFIYQENVNALYVNGRKSWKRLGAQLGLRAENTNIMGRQTGNSMVSGSGVYKELYKPVSHCIFELQAGQCG